MDTSHGIRPLDPKKIKIQYEVEEDELNEESKQNSKVKTENLRFSQFLMTGIPSRIRSIIYPILLANNENNSLIRLE